MIRFFKTHAVKISTSLDGPQWIHDGNRSDKSGRGSFSAVHDNIKFRLGLFRQQQGKVWKIQKELSMRIWKKDCHMFL